jgi:hypothetical protein
VSLEVMRRAALIAAAMVLAAASGALAGEPVAGETGPPATAVVKEYRYRMSAAIRPLLFWIGDSDVGGARIVWREGRNGRRGYEFLLGSDPARAPRRINRWGWVKEEAGPGGAIQVGLMRKTDEQTVDQAKAQVGFEGEYVFKMIRTRIEDGEARSENTVWLVRDDYTYYDLPTLLHLVDGPPQGPPKVNEAALPPGTEPGFLFAVADMVDKAVAAATREPRELLHDTATRFNFNAVVYDLRLREAKWEEASEYGGRPFTHLVRLDFESHNPVLDTTERFTLVCGTEGHWKGVPVYVKYQPKWWFKAEGVLDESQTFERPGARAGAGPPVGEPGGPGPAAPARGERGGDSTGSSRPW